MSCPICNAPLKETPQPSLHVFTEIFECGTQISAAFSAPEEFIFDKRCDELKKLEEQIKEVYKSHCGIHGAKGVVDYALIDDCVRKIRATKKEIKPIVEKLLKEE